MGWDDPIWLLVFIFFTVGWFNSTQKPLDLFQSQHPSTAPTQVPMTSSPPSHSWEISMLTMKVSSRLQTPRVCFWWESWTKGDLFYRRHNHHLPNLFEYFLLLLVEGQQVFDRPRWGHRHDTRYVECFQLPKERFGFIVFSLRWTPNQNPNYETPVEVQHFLDFLSDAALTLITQAACDALEREMNRVPEVWWEGSMDPGWRDRRFAPKISR